MTLDEFQQKYCALCGSQRCTGVYDEDLRDGCQHYREVFMSDKQSNKKPLTFKECLEEIKKSSPQQRMVIEAAELIAELRYMENVCKIGKTCPVPCQNECLFKKAADALEEKSAF